MVRISSTGEIIQDDQPNARNRQSSGFGSKLGSLSNSAANSVGRSQQGNSRSAFGTIDSIRTDNNFPGNSMSGEGGNGRPVYGGHDRGSSNGGDSQRRGAAPDTDIFSSMNQKLIHLGVPRIPIGPIVMEPIVLAGLGLSYLVLGARGLIFGGFLFGFYQYSNLRS
ncbi:uncharacterized protein LOC142340158 [Convolutriloba macropyga]|uniref:uncharacterized protein LOC142340158 n=1 Tax=Convolutriloba macropyga TaxID=536237 RepID=UPI003F527398